MCFYILNANGIGLYKSTLCELVTFANYVLHFVNPDVRL